MLSEQNTHTHNYYIITTQQIQLTIKYIMILYYISNNVRKNMKFINKYFQ